MNFKGVLWNWSLNIGFELKSECIQSQDAKQIKDKYSNKVYPLYNWLSSSLYRYVGKHTKTNFWLNITSHLNVVVSVIMGHVAMSFYSLAIIPIMLQSFYTFTIIPIMLHISCLVFSTSGFSNQVIHSQVTQLFAWDSPSYISYLFDGIYSYSHDTDPFIISFWIPAFAIMFQRLHVHTAVTLGHTASIRNHDDGRYKKFFSARTLIDIAL